MSIQYREFLEELRRINEDEIFIDTTTINKYFREWVKKCNYAELNNINEKEIAILMEKERDACLEARKIAMTAIFEMNAKEFQTRLLDGTLPDFPRAIEGDKDYIAGLVRDTCHPHILLVEEDFKKNIVNYAEAHRYKLRFMETEDFKTMCY